MNDYLTTEELCKALKIAKSTLSKLRNTDGLPFIRIGNLIRYQPSAIEEWLRETQESEESGEVGNQERCSRTRENDEDLYPHSDGPAEVCWILAPVQADTDACRVIVLHPCPESKERCRNHIRARETAQRGTAKSRSRASGKVDEGLPAFPQPSGERLREIRPASPWSLPCGGKSL